MNNQSKNIFMHLRRDALAGTITGIMAVPLTVGICLMSDYPIMTGLYTVIFAGVISFITYLYRPGNYTGMPGVAAGLAPALAMGVSTFGMENMPFVIALTATFQALVWKFRWEKYILRVVPHYLVEGLLAGVGVKIALKFVPFLYDIEHETDTWLNLERELVIGLSIVSFILFVMLYKYYKRRMPAMPYVVIMITSFILSFILPLPKVYIDSIPFQLNLPLPHLDGMNQEDSIFMLLRMIGFALMLGTIDIIEQIMSHVAIEKMDPRKRNANANNGLLPIWIANLGATFFGGMTNLDGLAKSTTNTVAGAVTKLSNLFTSIVLLLVVLFPSVLEHLPEYALGIIMVYSGWKMVANIANVRSEGRYALIMAAVCGLLVFELGIFEGLLLLLTVHAGIQYVFMRRLGKSTSDIWFEFRDTFKAEKQVNQEIADILQEPQVPVFNKWMKAINKNDLDTLMSLYSEDTMMIPAFSSRIKKSKNEVMELYHDLFEKDNVRVSPLDVVTQQVNGLKVDSGIFEMIWEDDGFEKRNKLRFSFVIKDGKITSHHSSTDPDVGVAIVYPQAYKES